MQQVSKSLTVIARHRAVQRKHLATASNASMFERRLCPG